MSSHQFDLLMSQIPTEELAEELAERVKREPFDLDKLKKGMWCFFCGQWMMAYPKDLDKRLVGYLPNILDCLAKNQRVTFEAHDALGGESRRVADFQKLHYFRIVEPAGDSRWKISSLGQRFIRGLAQLPARLWIYNWKNEKRRGVWADETMVTVDQLADRWQEKLNDYRMEGEAVSYAAIKQKALL